MQALANVTTEFFTSISMYLTPHIESGPLPACSCAASIGLQAATHTRSRSFSQCVQLQCRERAPQRACLPALRTARTRRWRRRRTGAWRAACRRAGSLAASARARPPGPSGSPLRDTGQACGRLSVPLWTRVQSAGRARTTARGHAVLAPARARPRCPASRQLQRMQHCHPVLTLTLCWTNTAVRRVRRRAASGSA